MRAVTIVCWFCIMLKQTNVVIGFFGGLPWIPPWIPTIPSIPVFNERGQLGNCYFVDSICNTNAIPLRNVPPYNEPLLWPIVTMLIVNDQSLNTKNCDSLCRCLTGRGGFCERSFPYLNSNGCSLLVFKCRCSLAYGPIQQAQAAVRLASGKVCL